MKAERSKRAMILQAEGKVKALEQISVDEALKEMALNLVNKLI